MSFYKCSADCSDSLKHFFLFLFFFRLFPGLKTLFQGFNKTLTKTIWQFDVTITVLILLAAINRPSITISITNTSWYPCMDLLS